MLHFLTAAVLLLAQENEGCPVIRGNPVNEGCFVVHEEKKVFFCCTNCRAKFIAAPEKYLTPPTPEKKTEEKKAPAPPPPPPPALTNEFCPVMEGRPVVPTQYVTHQGKTVFLCCKKCKARFLADPDTYVPLLPQFGATPPTSPPATVPKGSWFFRLAGSGHGSHPHGTPSASTVYRS